MTQPDDTGTTGGKTFTQAEVDAIVRDRLKRERDATATKYADYDDLKTKAAEADKSATQLDKIQQQMVAMSERAEKSERAATIREVADELKISVRQASRLSGKTKDELLADGRDFLQDFAPKGSTDGTGDTGKDDSGNGNAGGQQAPRQAAPARGRPQETMRSGAPVTPAQPEETDPRKLAELIPRH